MKRNIAKKALCLALLTVVLFTFAMSPAYALQGEAEFKPAESDIAGKYWVSSSVEDGVLLVDLGGAYDAVYKTEIIFEDAAKANAYLLQGSTDGEAWTALAARESGDAPAGGYTDVFSLAGLRYIRVTAYQGAIVKDLHIYNYLREDMNNGSDTSGVSLTNSYTYNEDGSPQDGVRGGVATPDTMETGENFFGLTKDMGWDTIRLRIWNEPRSEGGWQPEDVAEDGPLQAFPEGDPNGSCSPTQTLEYAKYVIGAGQDLAIDFHYADSWSDPQNQPKPYAWANLPFESEDADTKDLIDTTYDFTYEMIKALIDQGTAPTIVALGNEVTNGMMWGSEYGLVNPFADFHDYYKRFVRGNPDAPLGGGVEWINYEDSEGDTESAEYKSFEASITRLAKLVDAGQRAIRKLNEEYGLNIKTEMHFAFNVFERTSDGKIAMDPDFVSKKVLTLVGGLNDNLSTMSGMTDRIGVSYYPDWHGSYDQVQRNIVELSRMLPGVEFNIAECSPPSSGTVADYMDNPNHEVGFEYSVQSQGDDTIEILKLINDVPNNVGQGVWPWNGQAVYFGGGWYQNAEGTWSQSPPTTLASLKAFKDAFATGVIESTVYVTTKKGVAPTLPETVKELTVSDKSVSAVTVTWDVPQDASYDELGVFEIFGTAAAKGNMVDVVAIVTVVE